MNQCPQCSRIYPDSTQYCGTDGSRLVPAPPDATDDSRWRPGEAHHRTAPIAPTEAPASPVEPPVVRAPVTDPIVPPPVPGVRRMRRDSGPAPIAWIAAMVLVAGAAWWLWAHPAVAVVNRLATTVSVTMPSGELVSLPAGGEHRARLTRSQRTVRWQVTPDPALTPAAVPLDGATRFAFPALPLGRTSIELVADAGGDRFVAPLITNMTSGDLCILVNRVESSTTPRCDARVPPGAREVFVGYYPLGSNSSVRALRGDGAGATYPAIAGKVRRGSGAVPLSFSDRDFGIR